MDGVRRRCAIAPRYYKVFLRRRYRELRGYHGQRHRVDLQATLSHDVCTVCARLPPRSLCPRYGDVAPQRGGSSRILNFVVKDPWCNPSRYEWVESCLVAFSYERHGNQSAAFPWIGAMNGHLDFPRVQTMMRHHLRPLPIPITVYTFK